MEEMSAPIVSRQYQRFLKLLEKWPVDKSKAGRDLGEHLRDQVKQLINQESIITEPQAEQLTQQIASLERLASNAYGNTYRRTSSTTATGLSVEECSQVLSSESLKHLNEERRGFFASKHE